MMSSGHQKFIRYHDSERQFEEGMPNFIFSTMPVDSLAPLGKLMTKFGSRIWTVTTRFKDYRQASYIKHTLVGNKIVYQMMDFVGQIKKSLS